VLSCDEGIWVNRKQVVSALFLADLAVRQSMGIFIIFVWAMVWSWGCLEVSSSDPQAWHLPVATGAASLLVLGITGLGITQKGELPFWTRVARGVVLAMTRTRRRCMVFIAIGITGSWLSYRGLAGSIHPVFCNEKEILQWSLIGPERNKACGADVMQLWYPFGVPRVAVLDRNDRTLRGYCRSGERRHIDCLIPERPAAGPALRPQSKRELVIALFHSGDLQFTRAISAAFTDGLQRLATEGGVSVRSIRATGPTLPPSDPRGRDEWSHQIDYAATYAAQSKVDFLVGIGTQAARAIKELDGVKKASAKGFVFLGVTDPEGTGLVTSLHERRTAEAVAGVRYGSGARDFFDTVAATFPEDQPLTFIYEKGVSQDDYMAKEIVGLPRARAVALDHLPAAADFADPNAVYFAWYSLDKMIEQSEGLAALAHHTIVPSTYSPEILELAGIAVSVDDAEIGRKGAELVYKAFTNPSFHLGEQPVYEPKFKVWLDCSRLAARNIKLRPDAYQRASARVGNCP